MNLSWPATTSLSNSGDRMSMDAVPSGSDTYFAFVCAADVFWFCNYLKIDFLKDNTTKRVFSSIRMSG